MGFGVLYLLSPTSMYRSNDREECFMTESKKESPQGLNRARFAEFRRLHSEIAECGGYRQPLSESAAGRFLDLLKGHDWEQIERALVRHGQISSDYPSPAHVLALINGKQLDHQDESSLRHAAALELSKPTWERHGFDSQEALDAYNKRLFEEETFQND